MKIVGLTGGIGSGKTTIASMFEELGIPVYYADTEAKKLMNTSQTIRHDLIGLMGPDAYKNDEINRPYISKQVFKNKKMLGQLNAIVHPAVKKHFRNWVKEQASRYIIQENALIFEKNQASAYDYIITITAPVETRISRVMKRSAITRGQVMDRIENQMEESLKISNSSFVIHNLDLSKSREEVLRIHRTLMA